MIKSPYDIAAKLVNDHKSVSRDDTVKFVGTARTINEVYRNLLREVDDLSGN